MTNGEGDMKLAQETVDKFKSGTLHYAPWELLVKMFATTLATVRAEEREAAFNNLTSIIKQYIGSCPGHAQLQMLAALEEAKQHTLAVDESGWLLEKMYNGNVHYIAANYVLQWTDDPNKALRLARREDAEALTTIVEDCEKIAEHGWPTTAAENRKGEG